jgi:hypothetical protein
MPEWIITYEINGASAMYQTEAPTPRDAEVKLTDMLKRVLLRDELTTFRVYYVRNKKQIVTY